MAHLFFGQYFLFIYKFGGLAEQNLLRRVVMRLARTLIRPSSLSPDFAAAQFLIATPLPNTQNPAQRYAPDPHLKTPDDFAVAEQIGLLKNLDTPLIAHAFEVLRRSAIAAGIEPRYPFFDRELVDFCLTVPAAAKLRNGVPRWVRREALSDILPEKMSQRTGKAYFGNEIEEAVITYFTEQGDAVFADLDEYLDISEVIRLRNRLINRKQIDPFGYRTLWRICVLIQWLQVFRQWQTEQEKGQLIS